MALASDIEWTEATWNPVTGCTKISPGCKFCYAERMSLRLQAMGSANYAGGFKSTTHEHALELPLKWKKPRVIFVNSMSDLFHKDVPIGFIERVFDVMNGANWHTYQILTKRSGRLRELDRRLDWAPHIWMGVSVESAKYAYRADDLARTSAQVKFLSLEPLIAPVGRLGYRRFDWVIVGGESGPGARPIDAAWVRSIRDDCLKARTPFFFKQWGGVNKKKTGRVLDGRTWDEMPAVSSRPIAVSI